MAVAETISGFSLHLAATITNSNTCFKPKLQPCLVELRPEEKSVSRQLKHPWKNITNADDVIK